MDSFLINILEKVMEPLVVLNKERKVIYCTPSFKALVGEKTENCTCLDLFIPAFTAEGVACCWDVVHYYMKSKDCGLWVSKKEKKTIICYTYLIKINKDDAFMVVKLKPLHYNFDKDTCFTCYDGFLSLLKDKGIEFYRSYVKNYIRGLLKVRSVEWISKGSTSSLSSQAFRIVSKGYLAFDLLWKGKLFHVIGSQSTNDLLLIQGLTDLSQKELTELICAVEFTNSNLDLEKTLSRNVHFLTTLTRREREVFSLILKGFSNQEIANKLGISLNTVKNHVKSILSKTNTQRRTQLITKYCSIS